MVTKTQRRRRLARRQRNAQGSMLEGVVERPRGDRAWVPPDEDDRATGLAEDAPRPDDWNNAED